MKAMARNVKRATELLPEETEVVSGDLKNLQTIRKAAEGTDAVYLNLATYSHKADFKPELDGTLHVIEALTDNKNVLIAKISALGAAPDRSWPDADQKYTAEEAIRNSGHPYLLFRPTSFMESLPLFIRYKWLLFFGRQANPRYWIAGDDFGRQVAAAFRKENCRNRTFNIQGCEPLTFREASLRFTRAFDPGIRVVSLPFWPLKLAVFFKLARTDVVKVMEYTDSNPERLQSEETWKELGRPQMTIEGYANYIRETGDLPTKQPS